MVSVVYAALIALQQQPLDTAYTAAIQRFTSEPRFNTELTDHLPADPRVPTPLQALHSEYGPHPSNRCGSNSLCAHRCNPCTSAPLNGRKTNSAKIGSSLKTE